MRLQKYLAEAGLGSRRACEALIRAGRVLVNGAPASLGAQVEADDEVLLDGARVCTSDDPEGRRTLQDYFHDVPERLYNVGRLDLNSEGLLLMTNDGELANRLTHPRYGVEKTYYVVLDGPVDDASLRRLARGVQLDDGMTAPARVEHVRQTQRGDTSLVIAIREGRNRQIRRMAEAIGHRTLRLKRERLGPLTLDGLAPGQWRYLTAAELERLRASVGLSSRQER